ncbi:MAG TPA: AAA family ATPase [Euzebyales bacterium]
MRSAALIGRHDELNRIRLLLLEARRGSGGVLVVSGEAGVGKSRLIAEAMAAAEAAGMVVLYGRAIEDRGVFWGLAQALLPLLSDDALTDVAQVRPFLPALQRLRPSWQPAGTEPAATADPLLGLAEGVRRLLGAVGEGCGCLLVVEDLQWADRDTLGVVEYLAGAAAGVPVLVTVSVRSDERSSPSVHRLRRHPNVVGIHLERLAADAAAVLVRACARGQVLPGAVVDFVVDRSDGLPLLIEEVLAGLVDSSSLVHREGGWQVTGELSAGVSHTFADLVRRRLADVPAAVRLVIDAAAVLGDVVDWTLLEPATGLPVAVVTAGLRAAVAVQLLEARDAAGRLRWRHRAIRDAVLSELMPPQVATFAVHAAEAIEHRDPQFTGPDGALAAELYVHGGRGDHATQVLLALGRRARARGALKSAHDLLRRADELGTNIAVTIERVAVLRLAGRVDDAVTVGEAALPSALGDAHALLCLELARAAVAAGAWDRAQQYAARAGRLDDPRIEAIAADAAFGAGRIGEAASRAERAVRLAERSDAPEVVCAALEVVGRCAQLHDTAIAEQAYRRAAQVADEHGLVAARVSALLALTMVQFLDQDVAEELSGVRDLAIDAGMLAAVASIDLLLADWRVLVAGPDDALALAQRSADLAGQLDLTWLQAMALLWVAAGHAEAGRTGDTDACVTRARELAPDAPDVIALSSCIRALPPLLAHDLTLARDLLDEGIAVVEGHASAHPTVYWGLWVVVRTVLSDRDTQARDGLRAAPAVLRSTNRAALRYADAVAAARGGSPERAVELADEADRLLAEQHWWRRLLRVMVLEAALADGWGDPIGGLRALLADVSDGRPAQLVRICRDLLRVAGAPVPRRGRGDSAVPAHLRSVGVTSREMDVLVLVAQGLTNAEVAERLFLSRRTVETHVANLLAKTGAGNRAQLTHDTPVD